MIKRFLLFTLICAPLYASQEIAKIHPAKVFASHRLGKVELYHIGDNFKVMNGNKLQTIEKHAVDKQLRSVDKMKLAIFLNHGNLSLNKASDGKFTLKGNIHGKGGGALGATAGCWLGKAAVYLGAYGAIGIVAACTGPAAGVTFVALTTAWALPIEAASQVGAIAGGIAVGVATGPV